MGPSSSLDATATEHTVEDILDTAVVSTNNRTAGAEGHHIINVIVIARKGSGCSTCLRKKWKQKEVYQINLSFLCVLCFSILNRY